MNKKRMRGVEKYLVWWKGFTAEGDTWERRENLKNAEELIEEFEQREVVVRREVEKEGEYKRMELPGKYMAKLLYGWDDRKFEEEYLSKLEKNWKKWKGDRQINESEHLRRVEENMEEENEKIRKRDWRSFSRGETLKGGIMSRLLIFFFYINNLLHSARWQTVVATFVTTYRGSTLTWEMKKTKRKKKIKEYK